MINSRDYLTDTIQTYIQQCLPGVHTGVHEQGPRFNILQSTDYAVHMEMTAGRLTDEMHNKGQPLLAISSGLSSGEEILNRIPVTLAWDPLPAMTVFCLPCDVEETSMIPVFRLFKAMNTVFPVDQVRSHLSRGTGFPEKWFPDWDKSDDPVSYIDTCIKSWRMFRSIIKAKTKSGGDICITHRAQMLYGNPPRTQEDEPCSD